MRRLLIFVKKVGTKRVKLEEKETTGEKREMLIALTQGNLQKVIRGLGLRSLSPNNRLLRRRLGALAKQCVIQVAGRL